MPVRKALKKLTAEEVVEYLPYRGMRVREYSADDVTKSSRFHGGDGSLCCCGEHYR